MRMAKKKQKSYGKTISGEELTDELIEKYVEEAEEGYDVDELMKNRVLIGRPPMGNGPASVESVRLDPELRQALAQRAERDEETASSVIRKALRSYLGVG